MCCSVKNIVNVIYLCCFNFVRVIKPFIFKHCKARFIKIIGFVLLKFI